LLLGEIGAAQELRDIRPRPLAWAMDALREGRWDAAKAIAARDGDVAVDVIEWQRLRSGRGTVSEVQSFLARRADWPGLEFLRRQAEDAVVEAGDAAILGFFAQEAAQTPDGIMGHAAALRRDGQGEKAEAILLQMWRNAQLSAEEQARAIEEFGKTLAPHHAERLDQMLWRGLHANARQMFPLVSKADVLVAEARIGLRRRAGNVDALLAAVPDARNDDAGVQYERFEWRVRKGRWSDAKALLLDRSASKAKLGNPGAWAGRRRELARDELRDGNETGAYQMASQHYLTSGSSYADLEWLSGYIALTRLNEPAKALQHFSNHDNAVRSPISKGRAGYWKGRAHQALGDPAAADTEFTKGAAHQTSFYGLLAAEAAGLPFDGGLNDVPTQDWRTSPMAQDSLFQAGELLAASGERNLAERFWAHLAEQLSETDAALLGQAAVDSDEPHLAVMIGKAIARRGLVAPVPYYPLHPLKDLDLPIATELALAIARRESEFDPVVVSGADARGLMQLLPGTARDVARGLGISADHSTGRLTREPLYNARLGSQFLVQLAGRFEGNVVMVSAAYNAGPGRPLRWMETYGDPRGRDLDQMIDWIEGIPFRETRNYVMRVTESLPIFRARLGQDPLPQPFSAEILGRSLSN